ncbi:unnamed protein product [Urochloa humidicola]
MESLAILHVRPAALPPHAGLRLSLPCRRDPPHGAEAFPGNPPHPPLSKVCRSADHGEASLHCQGGCHSSITMMCSCKAASSMMPVLKSGSPLYFCSSYVCFLRDSENFSALKELNIQWPPTPTRGQPQAASDRNSHAYISYMTEPPQASGSVPCNQIFVGSFKVHILYPRRTMNQEDIMDTIVKGSLEYSDGLYWSLDYWSLVVHLNPPCVDCWNLQNSVIHVSPC